MGKLRDRAKEAHWRRVFLRYEASGLSVKRFCAREGLAEHRFHWWRRTLRERRPLPSGTKGLLGGARRGTSSAQKDAFLPVTLPCPLGAPIEVVHPRGYVVRVPAVFEPRALRGILATLEVLSAPAWEE